MPHARTSLIGASPGLIERDEPLAALARHLDEAAAGSGRFVVIRGEAGIGKTALLRTFLQTCPADVERLSGACDGVSTPQPFGPLEDMVGTLGPGLRALLDGNASRAEIGRWMLRRLSTGRHVLAIEDVHWADQATLELLAFLARRLEGLPLLVIVTIREDGDLPSSVARILGSLAALPAVLQLPLEPLTRAGVRRLAADRAAGVDIDDLHRISAGNPFYVNEVLASGSSTVSPIPVSIRDAVRARVAQLDARGRRALEVAAVIGLRAEPWLVAAIAGEDLTGIDDALRVGLLTKAEGSIAFRHELTRMAVLDDLPVIHGIALHRRTLAALERAGAIDAARLAYHAESAADHAAVLRHATIAGRRALAMGALNEAAVQFRRALRSGAGLADGDRAELLEQLANVTFLINELDDSYAAATEAIALRRAAGDVRMEGAGLSALAITSWVLARGDEAWQAARRAVALLEPLGEGRELAMAWCVVGRLGLSSGIDEVGRDASERAIEIGRRVGHPEATAQALTTVGTLDLIRGDERGWATIESALALGRDANLPVVVDRALNNLGVQAEIWRRLDAAEAWFDELNAHSERSEIERCTVYNLQGEIASWRGDWEAAERFARAAYVAPRLDPVDRSHAMVLLARLTLRRGEGDWRRWLVEPQQIAAGLETPQIRVPLASVAGEHAWIAGIRFRTPTGTPPVNGAAPILSEATDEAGMAKVSSAGTAEAPADALADLRSTYESAREQRDQWAIGELGIWLWRIGGLAELDDLAPEPYRLEVAGRIDEAAAAWERLGMTYDAAVCRAGSSEPGDLRRAHDVLTRLGATAVARKVADRMRDLGAAVPRGPRASTRLNVAGLTEREAEIARFLAEGLSNAEIAERLVLSPRTVGHHVSAVLGKLDVPRRGAVAAAMSDAGASG